MGEDTDGQVLPLADGARRGRARAIRSKAAEASERVRVGLTISAVANAKLRHFAVAKGKTPRQVVEELILDHCRGVRVSVLGDREAGADSAVPPAA